MRHTNHTSRWLMPMALLILIATLAMPHMAMAALIKLSGTMPAFGDVQRYFKISPDCQYVVYRADQDTDGVYELYSVPLSGGTAVKLNGALVTGGDVSSRYYISPDSSRVVYRADQETDAVYELYSVPIAGPASASVKLNGVMAGVGGVDEIVWISPDSNWVVYQDKQAPFIVAELYSVPITGPASASVKLNGQMVAGGDVWFTGVKISPDSSRVVYVADQETNEVYELYSVPIEGPASAGVKLNGTLVTGGDVGYTDFEISPDSSLVVYLADQDVDERSELYSVPLSGGTAVKLNGTLASGGDVQSSFEFSPDSSRVVYEADQDTDQRSELYSVPSVGPASAGVKLNGTLAPGGDVWNFQISPEGSRVVYKADQDSYDVAELYSVPIEGPASAGVKLNGALSTHTDVNSYQIGPDSSRVVYQTFDDLIGYVKLYSAPIAGPASASVKLNETVITSGDLGSFRISPDSSWVVYRADQHEDWLTGLYSVPIAGPASASIKLNEALPTIGEVFSDFQISPDSSQVVFRADQETLGVVELYAAELAAPTPSPSPTPIPSVYEIYLPLTLKNYPP